MHILTATGVDYGLFEKRYFLSVGREILKLDGGDMKKIYPMAERTICIFAIVSFSIIAVLLFVKYNSNVILVIAAYLCLAFLVLALLKLFSFPSHIVISNGMVRVFDLPLFATKRFYDKKRSLISYNSEINIGETIKTELIRLTKEEQKKYVGYRHLRNRYLKFYAECGDPKYVYVGNYSDRQIKTIISLINDG